MLTYNTLRTNVQSSFTDLRVRTYTVAGLSFLVVLLLTIFSIRPVVFKISSELGLYNDLQSKDTVIKTNLSHLAQDEDVFNQYIEGNTDILHEALPTTPATGALYANMSAIATSHNVTVTDVKFVTNVSELSGFGITAGIIPTKTGIIPILLTVSGNGAYSDINSFVNDLENYPRTFSVLEINLSTGSTGGTNTKPSSSFTMVCYVYYMRGI